MAGLEDATRLVAGVGLLSTLVACGGGPSRGSSSADEPVSTTGASGTSPAPPQGTPARPALVAEDTLPSGLEPLTADERPARPALVAEDTLPSGLEPLTADERPVLESAQCRAELEAVVVRLPRPGTGGVLGGATRLLRALAATTPRTACLELALRDTRVYLARTIEIEARVGLRGLARALLTASTEEGTALCPSAPPTPADLEALRSGPAVVDTRSLRGGPWDCPPASLFDDPVRYQYEIRTAPDGESSEIIARGFPVPDQPGPEVLYVRIARGEQGPPVVLRGDL